MALNATAQEHALRAMVGERDRLNLIIEGVNNSNSAAEDALEKWLNNYPSEKDMARDRLRDQEAG